MKHRKIVIELYEAELPASIHGCCSLLEDGSFMIVVNASDSAERREESFLHECLHIYRRDHEKESVAEIELAMDEA